MKAVGEDRSVTRKRDRRTGELPAAVRRLLGSGRHGVVIETKDSKNQRSFAVVRRVEDGKAQIQFLVDKPSASEADDARNVVFNKSL
jgi:hypothetical protein